MRPPRAPLAVLTLLAGIGAGAAAGPAGAAFDPPACFGARVRDPIRPCHPTARLRVMPTPAQARRMPNAPCSMIDPRAPAPICTFARHEADATGTIALVGDSHASHWRGALEVAAQDRGWHGLSITHSSCPLSLAVRDLPEPKRSRCARWRRALFALLAGRPEITTLFVSALSGGASVVPSGGRSVWDTAVAGYRAAWKALPRSVHHVVVLRDTPKMVDGTAACIEHAMARHRRAGEDCARPRAAALGPDPMVAAARQAHSQRVRVVDLTRFFCGRRCEPVIGGALVYKDSHHITATYATTLGPMLDRALSGFVKSWS